MCSVNYLSVTIAGFGRTMDEEIEDELNQGRRVGRVGDFKEEIIGQGDARRQPIDVRFLPVIESLISHQKDEHSNFFLHDPIA